MIKQIKEKRKLITGAIAVFIILIIIGFSVYNKSKKTEVPESYPVEEMSGLALELPPVAVTPTVIPTVTPLHTPTPVLYPTSTPISSGTSTPVPTIPGGGPTGTLIWYSTLDNTAAITSAPNVGSAASANTCTFTTGRIGQGILCDASGENVDMPMSGNLNGSTGAIEFWYKKSGTIKAYSNFFESSQGMDYFSLERSNSDTALTFYANTTAVAWTGVTNVFDGGWHHIRVTYNTANDIENLYIDGVSQGQKNVTLNPVNTGYNLVIGDQNGSQPAMGIIDEFKVYSQTSIPTPQAAGTSTPVPTIPGGSPTGTVASGLVAYLKFDEGTGLSAVDSSGNGNYGTLVDSPAWVAGKLGRGLSFDGVNDYVNVGKKSSLNNLTSFTWSAWIYPRGWGENNFGRIMGKTSSGGFEKALYLASNGILRFNFNNSNGTNFQASSSTNVISLNTWQHVAVIFNYNGDKKPHLYINGKEVSYSVQNTMSGTPWNDSNYNLMIGNRMNTDRTFNGIIDEVKIYSRILSAEEIKTLAQ